MGKKKIESLTHKQKLESIAEEKNISITSKQAKVLIKLFAPYMLSILPGGRGIPVTIRDITHPVPIKDKKVLELINKRKEKRSKELKCFIGHNFNKRKINSIRPVINGVFKVLKIKPYYADEVLTDKTILNKVFSEILKSDFVIFDITTKMRTCIVIEIGAALIKRKIRVFLIKEGEKMPEVLKGPDLIKYKNYDDDLVDQLLNKLPGFLKEQKLI